MEIQSRLVIHELVEAVDNFPAVALLGVRQIGKTTLALEIAKKFPSIYLDLESPEDLVKLNDPLSFFAAHKDKLIILDEIQRAPELFAVLRGVIDKNRREGRRSKNFLLLGSASMDLLRQSSESLAGRICYLEMSGFNLLEVPEEKTAQKKLWLRGGFPDSYFAKSDTLSMNWLENMVRSYLERDVAQMGFRIPAVRLRRLWTMLAHLHGETVNFAQLATNLEVDAKTVSSYIEILVDLFLVHRLEPWHSNAGKRLTKSPRFYIKDSGILHRLLGITSHDSLLSNPVLGKSFEGFVIGNILSVLPPDVKSFFYRTAAGAEVDLVLKMPGKELWVIEVKHGRAPKIARGFTQACADLKATRKFVVYGGEDEFPIQNNVTVLSLARMLEILRKFFRKK